MSFAVDVNVLLYASNESGPHHRRARDFLEHCATGTEVFCLAWVTLMSYLRMATHPRLFANPLSPETAAGNVEALLSRPHCRALGSEEQFWQFYRRTCTGLTIRGNLVPDAHLAAVLLQHEGRVLYTNDRDFKRFDFLDVRNPLVGEAD